MSMQIIKQSKDGKDVYEICKTQDAPLCHCGIDLTFIVSEYEDYSTGVWFYCKECSESTPAYHRNGKWIHE